MTNIKHASLSGYATPVIMLTPTHRVREKGPNLLIAPQGDLLSYSSYFTGVGIRSKA